jgi:hypothetical protein
MMTQPFNWRGVLWSAVLIFLIPFILYELFGLVYGLYVGFQVRGDPERIAEGFSALNASPLYHALPYVLTAAVAFWRGQKIGNISAALIAAGLGALLFFVVVLTRNPLGSTLIDTTITFVVAAGTCALGALRGGRRAVTA